MSSDHVKGSFEHALYLQRVGLPWRRAMVQCGVDALLDGADGPETARLAGADDAGPEELEALFRSSALEVGVSLPRAEEEEAWVLRRTEAMEREGRAVLVRPLERVFVDREYLIRRRLAAAPSPELTTFLEHLERPRDAYDSWLHRLVELATPVVRTPGVTARVVAGLTDVLQAQSYGATTQDQLDVLAGLLAELGER